MNARVCACLALCSLMAGVLACDRGSEPAATATPPQRAASKQAAPIDDGDPLAAPLQSKAEAYAPGLVATSSVFRGQLDENGRQDFLAVLDAGHCYRFVGVGGAGVEDLDLVLFDPRNLQVQRDIGRDPYPVLGVEAEMCLQEAGAYRLQVKMTAGSGAFRVGLYRTED